VLVVLPIGSNDINRVSSATRIIAIDTPNTQTVTDQTWGFYRTSVDAIEAASWHLKDLPVDASVAAGLAVELVGELNQRSARIVLNNTAGVACVANAKGGTERTEETLKRGHE
jgi:hypothetical protein